ncbi:hypothetical protein K8O68_16090 [Salipaludibacillus sp. CUR1]|jgi:hypothetical protein|uniref:hypothetical protein n=1 Tax=Salipaludibacillus sp. CUR1 TaxID=2820003 RepID=UPI001E556389|nr:hypothetical protein [Salipaludibacillus sp. CUR1]MCE7793915.1 hypothetical protein [Salipaludibacillus sp. CUR1]
MLGFMCNGKEAEEMEYLLKRELEELLLDLTDDRLDGLIRHSMEERYKIIYKLYKRFASPKDIIKYVRKPSTRFSKNKI